MSTGHHVPLRTGFALVSAIAFAIAMLTPMLEAADAEASSARTSQQRCDPGFVLNEQTGECEPIAIPAQIQAQPTCEPGSAITEQCEQDEPGDFQQVPQDCPEGTERNEDTGECLPIATEEPPLVQECPEGTTLDQASGQCVDDTTEDVPPAEPTNPPLVADPTEAPQAGEATQENSVTVRAFRCPPGAPYDTHEGDLIDICGIELPDVEFTFSYEADESDTFTELTNASGVVEWSGPLVAGGISIEETIPPGYLDPYAFCADVSDPGPMVWNTYPSLPNGLLVTNIAETTNLECRFYNIAAEGASVTIHNWNCPYGTPFENPSAECTEAGDGVAFTIGDGSAPDPDQTRTTGDDGPGTVTFAELDPGAHTVTEEVPAGISYATAWCVELGVSADVLYNPPRVEFELEEGDHVTCDWYNVRDDSSSITIRKWTCPPGYEIEQGNDPLVDCTEVTDGVTFHIDDGNPPAPDQTRVTGDDGPGTVTFTDLEAGTHTVTEDVPAGIAYATGWCASVGQVLALDDPPRLEFDLQAGVHWDCDWLNVPDEDEYNNAIEIEKWECPEGTLLDQTKDYYEANCVNHHDGVQFTVGSGAGLAIQDTAGGTATFPWLPAGKVMIWEGIPEGFGAPMIFCGIEGNPQHFPAPTGYWEFEFADDDVHETLVCHVYNVPGGPGSVTINKWTCPPGYDLNAAGADPQIDCTEATNGVEFQFGLDDPMAVAELQTTGDIIDGGVIFEDLEPDIYKAVELVPEGIDHVFVLKCTGHIMGQLQPFPLQMGNVLGEIDVDAGEHLVCDWYNVPETEGGELTVIKYICSTEAFVSELDCEIYEDGATFDLLYWSGTWDLVGTDTTDGFGRIQWTELQDGEYWLEEHDGEWCHIASDELYEDGPWFLVSDSQETVVHVYNCDSDWTTTTIPEKYPNTGAEGAQPHHNDSPAPTETPTFGVLLTLPLAAAARHARLRAGWHRPPLPNASIAA